MKKLYLRLSFMALSAISTTSMTASEQKSTGLPLSVESMQELAQLQLIAQSLKEKYDDCEKNNATNDMRYFYHHLRQNYFSQRIILDPANADRYHQECDKASKAMDQALSVKINSCTVVSCAILFRSDASLLQSIITTCALAAW